VPELDRNPSAAIKGEPSFHPFNASGSDDLFEPGGTDLDPVFGCDSKHLCEELFLSGCAAQCGSQVGVRHDDLQDSAEGSSSQTAVFVIQRRLPLIAYLYAAPLYEMRLSWIDQSTAG